MAALVQIKSMDWVEESDSWVFTIRYDDPEEVGRWLDGMTPGHRSFWGRIRHHRSYRMARTSPTTPVRVVTDEVRGFPSGWWEGEVWFQDSGQAALFRLTWS